MEEQPSTAAPSVPTPKQSPKMEKAASFARANREHAPGWSHPSSCIRGTSEPQEVREPSLVQVTEAQPC